MTIKCIKACGNDAGKDYITVGREYAVLEIICTKKKSQDGCRIHYRIIDNHGVPGMYKVEYFEIMNSELANMVICEKPYGYVITHRLIADSSLEKENVNGFWGVYFETENIIAKRTLEDILYEYNKEGTPNKENNQDL